MHYTKLILDSSCVALQVPLALSSRSRFCDRHFHLGFDQAQAGVLPWAHAEFVFLPAIELLCCVSVGVPLRFHSEFRSSKLGYDEDIRPSGFQFPPGN